MKVYLSPIVSNHDDTPLRVSGDTITYRGETYELSQLPNGSEVEADEPFVGKIKRDDQGVIHLSLQYCYTTETAELIQSKSPDDYTFDITNGECPCPIKRKPVREESVE